MKANSSNSKLICDKTVGEIFDAMADAYTDEEKGEGAVVLAISASDDEMAFNAAHGDFVTIIALITSMIRRTAEDAHAHPLMICELIARALVDAEKDDERKN